MYPFTSFGDPRHAWLTLVWLAVLGLTGLFGYMGIH
jgi:hypothetical protein